MSYSSGRPPLPPIPPAYVDIARRPSPSPGYGGPGRAYPSPPAFVASPPAHQQGFAPQRIVAPVPSRLPSHIPARELESQASAIGVGARDGGFPGAYPPSPPQSHQPQYFPPIHQQPRLHLSPTQPVVSPPTPDAPAAFPSPPMSPYAGGRGYAASPSVGQLSSGMAGMAMDPRERRTSSASYARSPDSAGSGARSPSSATAGTGPGGRRGSDHAPLAMVMPTLDDLAAQRVAAGSDPSAQVRWARELLRYVERTTTGSSITDARLVRWIDEAVRNIVRAAGLMPPVPEALYLRADLAMSGSFPSLVPKNPKLAFRDFEAAANAEYAQAWYRIGREYESFNDMPRAHAAYESGLKLGDVTSTYRLAMAYLLGQLNVPVDTNRAIELLRKSAMIADRTGDADTAAPLYVWGLVLAGEFDVAGVDPASLPNDPIEAGRWMAKAAYLGHVSAQHKMGKAHEFAQLGEAFDPLLSVQWYSLASQQGDPESDLALSKWFLCGAEGYFDTNESLAFTFAEKAASKNLPAGAFAVAYYFETGIGTEKNVDTAKRWYRKGNEDARGRLDALERSSAASMSRAQHEHEVNERLTRRRTQARIQSESAARNGRFAHPRTASTPNMPLPYPSGQRPSSKPPAPTEFQRRNTIRIAEQVANTGWDRTNARPSPTPQHSATLPTNGADGRQRYSLTDRPTSGIGLGPAPAPPQQASTMPSPSVPVAVVPPKKGPSTFAEMGVPEAKLKKDDCVVQ